MEEPELPDLLSEVDLNRLKMLHKRMKSLIQSPLLVCRDWVTRELAGRLVNCFCLWSDHGDRCIHSGLWFDDEDHCIHEQLLERDQEFQESWHIVLRNFLCWQKEIWAKAAGVVMATFAKSVRTPLEVLDLEVLEHAYYFLNNRREAIAFAKGHFKSDLRIADRRVWPPTSSAYIHSSGVGSSWGRTKGEVNISTEGIQYVFF